MRCKLVSLQKSNINRICVRVHGIHGTIYLLPNVNWILLLMNMSEETEFLTTLCKSPKLNFNRICKGVYRIQWTPCYTAFMGKGVYHQHKFASCKRKTLTETQSKIKSMYFPSSSFMEVFLCGMRNGWMKYFRSYAAKQSQIQLASTAIASMRKEDG